MLRPRLGGTLLVLLSILACSRVALARDAALEVDTLVGVGHITAVPAFGACETTAHEMLPFEVGGRGRWQAGPLVLRAGGAITADLALAEESVSHCMYAADGGGFADPPADQEVGEGNLRFGLQGLVTVGESGPSFGFDVGALVLTEPLWASWAPPILPSLSLRFGSRQSHAYLGIFDTVPVITMGGLLRTGAVFATSERGSLDLGIVWGPDVQTFSLSAGFSHRLQDSARVFATLRLGARLLFPDELEEVSGLPQVSFALGYGWPTG